VLRRIQQEAERQAAQVVASAENQATEVLREAQAEAELLRSTARDQGRDESTRMILSARQQARSLVARAETELTDLAVRIAEKVVGAQLDLHPDTVRSVVARCLSAATARDRVVARVNPVDLPRIEAAIPELLAGADVCSLVAEVDPAVAPGGCILDTDSGQIDGQIDNQLAIIRAALGDEKP
jgi:type III secretion protein L